MLMQKGIYKYRTDTRRYKRELHKEEAKLLDYKMHLVIRFILFLKYLITFRMQDAKDALDMDNELLYKNMVAAKAQWLYELEEWNDIITPERQKELYKEEKRSGTIVKEKKIGRNDPCPCGSGKKYKHCCGR